MYKLKIGVGYSIFDEKLNPFAGHQDLIPMIRQHRIMLSEAVIEYYQAKIPEEFSDFFMTFLDSIMTDDESSCFFVDDPDKDARQNLIKAVKQTPMRTLITYKEEFGQYNLSGVEVVTPESISNHDDNAFNRYTFPIVNHVAKEGSNCELYASWLEHLFEGEDRIKIIDPYIFSGNGRRSLNKYYLSKIQEGAEIDIYCELYKSDYQSESEMLSAIRNDYSKWNIHVHLCEFMHDRYILLSSAQISFGAGLDFLNCRGRIRKNCTISVTTDREIPMPTVLKTIC